MPGDLQGDYQLNLATIFGKVGGLAALPRRQMDGHGIAGQRPGKSSGRAARLITEYENLMMPNCASQVWHLNRLIRFIRQCLTALRFAVKKTSGQIRSMNFTIIIFLTGCWAVTLVTIQKTSAIASHCNPDFKRALERCADPGRGCGLR